MATHSLEVLASLLDDRINILEKDVTKYSPAKQVFGTIGAILALARDRINAYKETVQLSDYCFDVCEALKATIQEENADDLGEFATIALGDVGSVICEIERTLKTKASLPHVEYDKGEIERKKLKIQETLDALNRHSSSSNGDGSLDGRALQSPSLDSHNASMTSVADNAFGRLLKREFVSNELPSLIEAALTSKDVDDKISRLPSSDAQTLVDVLYEVLDMPGLSLSVRVKCLRRVYRTCGRHGLLPKALKVPICYDRTVYPRYSGGNADVWKGEYCGRDVAVKVIRTYSSDNLKKILGRFCKESVTWKSLRHPNILPLIGVTMSESHFAMVSDWMDNGSINEFLRTNPDANRLDLLRDIATGLIYIHQRGMIHGDLKGDNILIDQTGHARLADFGFLTIISDAATFLPSSSFSIGGTLRWMSPELIAPGKFGLEASRPTKSSDCYSLGMVAYEMVSGKKPYQETPDVAVFLKIVEGERPRRCEGFVDGLWGVMEQCWTFQPSGRPSIEGVLQCLETCSNSSPSPPGMDGSVGENTKHNKTGGSERSDSPSTSLSRPQSGSSELLSGPPQDLATVGLPGNYATSASDAPDPPSGPVSLAAPIITASSQSVPALHVHEIDWDTVPPEFKKQGSNWFTVSNPKTERVIDVSLMHTLPHERWVKSVRFSADGKYLATTCGYEVKIYDAETCIQICLLVDEAMPQNNWGPYLKEVCFSPDGKLLVALATNNVIRVWDIAKTQINDTFRGDDHPNPTCSVAFLLDGRLVISSLSNDTVMVRDVTDGTSKTLVATGNAGGKFTAMTTSSNGQLLATGDGDGGVCIWHAHTGELLETLPGRRDYVNNLAFTPDSHGLICGRRIAEVIEYCDISPLVGEPGSYPDSPGVSKHDASNGSDTCTVKFTARDYVAGGLAVSHDSQWVINASLDGQVRFRDAKTWTVQLVLRGHGPEGELVCSVDHNPRACVLATGGSDKMVRIWKYSAVS